MSMIWTLVATVVTAMGWGLLCTAIMDRPDSLLASLFGGLFIGVVGGIVGAMVAAR
jgi:uncharacterized membrane-anchored protein YitT (DUF2179 family)